MTGNTYLNCSDEGFRRHVCEEHRQIDSELNRLFACCLGDRHGCDQQYDWDKLRERLLSLRQLMVTHFHEEEEGSCLDEAVSRRTTLAGEARAIEREHPELLTELDGLIQWINDEPPLETTLQIARTRFKTFAENLRRHEQRENALIRQGLGLGDDE
ncbi:MAG: hemerythrin domain-containing protein [Blastopirellula sp. JB062]